MFDASTFLAENFRSPAELAAWLRAYGVTPPKESTIYAWFRRGSIPMSWGGLLAGLLEVERGGLPILSPYLRLPQ